MRNIHFLLVLIILFQPILVFAQDGYHHEDENSQSWTPNIIDLTVYRPHFSISKEDALTMTLTGLKTTREGKEISAVIVGGESLIEYGLDVPKKSVEHRNEQYNEQLVLISKDAKRLQELHNAGVDLSKNWEAGDIINRLKQTPKDGEDVFLFFRKSLLSGTTLYTIATEKGSKYLADKLFWKEDKKPTDLTKTMWKRLKVQSDFVNKYMKSLSVELSNMAAVKTIKGLFDKSFDDFVNDLLAKSHSESIYVGVSYFRQDIYFHPEICLPEIQLLAAKTEIYPAVEAVRPDLLIAPAQVYRYNDKVVNSFSIEQQVINRQNYHVSSNYNYHSETITTNYKSAPINDGPSEAEIQRHQALHEELMKVGDGKTYEIGPLSTSGNWDGRKNTGTKDESH